MKLVKSFDSLALKLYTNNNSTINIYAYLRYKWNIQNYKLETYYIHENIFAAEFLAFFHFTQNMNTNQPFCGLHMIIHLVYISETSFIPC